MFTRSTPPDRLNWLDRLRLRLAFWLAKWRQWRLAKGCPLCEEGRYVG